MTNTKTIILCLLFSAGSALASTKSTTQQSASHENSITQTANNDVAANKSSLSEPQSSGYQCEGKSKCGQMDSCEEAEFYLNHCGKTRLDRDGDGIPCESLCE